MPRPFDELLSSPLLSTANAAIVLAGSFVAYSAYKLVIFPALVSPLRKLPHAPRGRIPLLGNMPEIVSAEVASMQFKWAQDLGDIFVYYGLFSEPRVAVLDPKMLLHILSSRSYDYPKPSATLKFVGPVLGIGLVLAEGDVHRRQRRMLQPAFAHRHIKAMAAMFDGPARKLTGRWGSALEHAVSECISVVDADGKDFSGIELDLLSDLSRTTLDVIGIVGFGHDFGAADSADAADSEIADPLCRAYANFFNWNKLSIISLLYIAFPILDYLPNHRNRVRRQTVQTIDSAARAIVRERMQDKEGIENGTDLLSVILRETEYGTVSEDECKAHIMTFLLAGHETSSVVLAWTLYSLAGKPEAQDRLRSEINAFIASSQGDTDAPLTFDQVHSLKYLDCVLREVLRLFPPVPLPSRVAIKDDVLPGGHFIPKGTIMHIIPGVTHLMSKHWGDDVREFRPERWLEGIESMEGFNYIYMPFLTGPRSCIGMKLAQTEMKVLLVHILRKFEFRLVPGFEIKKQMRLTLQPGPTLKLLVARV